MPIIPSSNDKEINQSLSSQKDATLQRSDADKTQLPGGENSQHQNQHATLQDHAANLGPVVGQDLGKVAGKEELRQRAEELNNGGK